MSTENYDVIATNEYLINCNRRDFWGIYFFGYKIFNHNKRKSRGGRVILYVL